MTAVTLTTMKAVSTFVRLYEYVLYMMLVRHSQLVEIACKQLAAMQLALGAILAWYGSVTR